MESQDMEMEIEEEEQKINLLNLPVLNKILSYLDVKSLLAAMETCSYMNEFISSSKPLMKNVKFVIKFVETEDKRTNKAKLDGFGNAKRRYQNIKIIFLKENYFSKPMWKQLLTTAAKQANDVTSFCIENCYSSRNDVVSLLKKFTNLIELRLVNIMFSDDFAPSQLAQEDTRCLNVPNLKVFQLLHGDFFCMLLIKLSNKLHTLEIHNPSYNRTDVEEIENFLLNQPELKHLSLNKFRFNSSYSTHRLASLPFQLHSLKLIETDWDMDQHAQFFIFAQKSLKYFELRQFQKWFTPREGRFFWFCSLMRHLIINQNNLMSVLYDERYTFADFKDSEFLVDDQNSNVKNLTYIRIRKDSEMLTTFARLFPCLTKLKLHIGSEDSTEVLQQLERYPHLSELSLRSKKVFLDFLPAETMRKLKKFHFRNFDESKTWDILKNLLSTNTTMENLALNIEPLTCEQICELVITFSSTLKSLKIRNFYLNTTEAELFIQNFPQLRHLSSDINPNAQVEKILRNAQIKFTRISY